MNYFKLIANFKISGDQPLAIKNLTDNLVNHKRDLALLGVTGSGKTFTMANVISKINKTTMIIAPNKTLAVQLYEEMKSFFPYNAVEYFVSYYDYYQPEAYIPQTDTYIEKDALINDKIDLLRHSATRSLLERKDVIVVASVSCIYGLGAPELYLKMTINLKCHDKLDMHDLQKQLVELQYKRAHNNFTRGQFRVRGDTFDIFPSHYENRAWRLSFFGNELESIVEFDPVSNIVICKLTKITIFASSHYVTPRPTLQQAITLIEEELEVHLASYHSQNKLLEAERIEQRTKFDIEMIKETGTCKGIENYSRYLSGKKPGEPPPTLFEYLPNDAIIFIDESHVTIPQIGAMYNGDRARKLNLIKYGFRLPSALDNRPLKFEEWEKLRTQTIYVSATLGKYELTKTNGHVIEQVIRPTGLLDPICIIKPATNQVDDVISESHITIKKGFRVLITTLTKKMAENLSDYMKEIGINVTYLHSDITTLNRIEIINNLRSGIIDVLIGVNLLREGLDIPECQLVAIMDADKEGFLRSETSLIQTIGRAARNSEGRVILYANKITGSLQRALDETTRRRNKQMAYNQQHNITPTSISKPINDSLAKRVQNVSNNTTQNDHNSETNIDILKQEMLLHAENLEFEKAAKIRDTIKNLKNRK